MAKIRNFGKKVAFNKKKFFLWRPPSFKKVNMCKKSVKNIYVGFATSFCAGKFFFFGKRWKKMFLTLLKGTFQCWTPCILDPTWLRFVWYIISRKLVASPSRDSCSKTLALWTTFAKIWKIVNKINTFFFNNFHFKRHSLGKGVPSL